MALVGGREEHPEGALREINTARAPSLNWLRHLKLSWRVVFLLLLFGVIIFMTAYPTALLFFNSFQVNQPGEQVAWGLDGWLEALADDSVPKALVNTFSLAVVRTIITTFIAIFFAWRRIYRRADDCNPDNTCATPSARKSYKVMFWLVAVLTLTALAYPYAVPFFY